MIEHIHPLFHGAIQSMTIDIRWIFPNGFILSNKGESSGEDANPESGGEEGHYRLGLAGCAAAAITRA